LICIACIACSVWSAGSSGFIGNNSSITKSTVAREKLPASAVHETGYYTDADGDWIRRPDKLISGMQQFYRETGVQPYLYILPNGTTSSFTELAQRADELYDQLFDDNAHFLLVFCDDNNGSYNCGYAVGSQAKTIMDSEALSIFADYLDRYYQDFSLDEEEIFSKAFADTGTRIMTVEKSPLVPIVISIVVVIVSVLAFFTIKKLREQRARERQQIEEIIRTPLEKFADIEVENLAKKYEENIPNNDRIGVN